MDFKCTVPQYARSVQSHGTSSPRHTSAGSLVSMNGVSTSWRACTCSLHVRPSHQQEVLQPYPNRPTETGNTNSRELITGSGELSQTNYCSYDNSNLDQERDSRNQRGKLFDSFKQKLCKVSTGLPTPKLLWF